MFFPLTSFHTFFIKAHPLSFDHPIIQRGSYYIIWVKCQPFLKCSGYYVADLTTLNLTDPLIGEFSEPSCFCTFSNNFNSEDTAWLSSLQTLLINQNFHIAKYFSVIGLLSLFHSLVYQTFYNFTLRRTKEFRMDQWMKGG